MADLVYYGKVIKGNQIGRKIGIPTINIPVSESENDALPAFGVYAARINYLNEKKAYGVANLGVKPTIKSNSGSNPVSIEVNIFDFEGDLYGQDVTVILYDYIRPEMKFESIEALQNQIFKDIDTARKILDDKIG